MVSSGVGLDDDLGGVELVVEVGDSEGHVVGGEPSGLVGQDVGVLAAHVGSDDDYAGLGACGPGGHGGVYGDDDAGDGRVAPEPGFLDPLAFPESVFVLVGDLGVYLLLSYAGAVVAVDDPVEERGREVVLVIEGGAACDESAGAADQGAHKLYGLGGGGDD